MRCQSFTEWLCAAECREATNPQRRCCTRNKGQCDKSPGLQLQCSSSDAAAEAKRHACCVATAHHRCAAQSQMTSPASQPPASWQMYRRMAGRSVALSTACTPASMGCTMKGIAAAWGGVDRARAWSERVGGWRD